MNTESTDILNSFITAPDLKINSEEYPFECFDFQEEIITGSEFQFPTNSIIGLQAEACFEAYIIHSRRYKLLSSNLQIPGKKETLGELDYIVQNLKTKEIVHIELACKFYLYDKNIITTEESKWIGPNRKDSLYDKLQKIRSKQFPLITANETIEKLESLGINIPTRQELCLKAYLFVPKEIDINSFSKKYQDCIVGHWMRQSDFVEEDADFKYAIPNKKEWILPYDYIITWLSFDEIQSEVNKQIQNQKSLLIYKSTSKIIERFFVVWW